MKNQSSRTRVQETVRKRLTRTATMLFTVVGLVSTVPAGAGTAQSPEISDVRGDANVIFAYGGFETPAQDTRPVSIDSADVVAAWFRTSFETTQERDSEGRIARVVYVPTGLQVTFQTTAPLEPPPSGHGIRIIAAAELGSACSAEFRYEVRAPSLPVTTVTFVGPGCPLGVYTTPQFTAIKNGEILTVSIPFSGLSGTPHEGRLQQGSLLAFPDVYTQFYDDGNTVSVDRKLNGRDFVVGSDVPPNIECEQTPEHAECAG